MRTDTSPLLLGIDTGGTYTDAVLWSEADHRIVAKAKALTTRHDLSVGIGGAVDAVLAASDVVAGAIKLVSLSTTLATNALVEGQGGRAALVMIGFSERDLSRDGLSNALGGDPVIYCAGGHDVHGNAAKLDLEPLRAALPELAASVTAIAVCSHFATRNPSHELAALDLIAETGLPATASHQLTSKLGGPRRALTALLNARLIATIERLVEAVETFMSARGIDGPLMVVRGDGALVSAGFAKARPIETILSGPAASLVGALCLTGLPDAVVSDIGGTTTDVAVLDKGTPCLDPEGATVGGYRTMVEAVAMHTFGLGGDSEVALEESALDPKLLLGPRRLLPLSLAATSYGEGIAETLRRQLAAETRSRLDGRFAVRSNAAGVQAVGLSSIEAKLYESVASEPLPLQQLLASASQQATLNRLVARGLVHIIGFTPSDAAHVLGLQSNWNAEVAELGAQLFAARRDGRGQPIASDGPALAQRVLDAVKRASAETILETALTEDGLDGDALVREVLVQRALNHTAGIARLAIALDRPLIGLGASAGLHYAGLDVVLGQPCVVPPDADVANAVGAVVGQVRVRVSARISQPVEGVFRVDGETGVTDFRSEAEALVAAEASVRARAMLRASEAGAAHAELDIARDTSATVADGQRIFVEAFVTATAVGRPAIASGG